MEFKKRKKEPGDIEVDIEDVEIIMGDDYKHLNILLDSSFCSYCEKHTTTIVNYVIYLTKLEDLVFQGQCVRCKNPVGRYIETGENKIKADIARHIRTIKSKYKTIKTKK